MILRPYSRSCRTASIRSGIAGGLAGEVSFIHRMATLGVTLVMATAKARRPFISKPARRRREDDQRPDGASAVNILHRDSRARDAEFLRDRACLLERRVDRVGRIDQEKRVAVGGRSHYLLGGAIAAGARH
jgi:hypothetical protein